MSNLYTYFETFEENFKDLDIINNEWYRLNCGVLSEIKKAKTIDNAGDHSEEWYRARMVWSLIESNMFPPENFFIEFSIPKGSPGARSLNPDIVIFKDRNWINIFNDWDKTSAIPDSLCKEFLIFFEAKDNPSKIINAITKQLFSAMKEYQGEQVFGVYFDNKTDLLIFRKEGTNPVKRYNPNKMIDGEGIVKLNLDNRDNLEDLPNFINFLENISLTEDLTKLNFKTNQPIDEDSFSELLNIMNRMQDRLNISHIQDLIVEFLTLKVTDEKSVKKDIKKYFDFYITEDEKNYEGYGNQNFRNRINELYIFAIEEYTNIFTNQEFAYIRQNGNLRPRHGDDEKFLIGLIEVFQKKTILETTNKNFNQIIFNNFGSNIEKAKEKQFFTPIPLVEAMVKMLNPDENETICDPCSGIGDFLAMSFKHIYKEKLDDLPTAGKFYAFDKDNKILKLAELNLVLNGDGNANIKIMDSLSNKLLVNGNYNDTSFNIDNFNLDDWTNRNDSNRNVKRYDIVITNPPFGKGRDLKTGHNGKWDIPKKTIALYETWEISKNPNSIDMGILYLENAYKLLEPGGRMAIVLSNSIASIKQWEPVRKWFLSKMRIVALFDLPANTFGETGVSTTVFIAYKPKPNELSLLDEDYEIFVREIENLGYTVQSKERIIIMSPNFVINENTFKKEEDKNGNYKLLTDFPSMVNGFYSWLQKNKFTNKEIFNAFHGDHLEHLEI